MPSPGAVAAVVTVPGDESGGGLIRSGEMQIGVGFNLDPLWEDDTTSGETEFKTKMERSSGARRLSVCGLGGRDVGSRCDIGLQVLNFIRCCEDRAQDWGARLG